VQTSEVELREWIRRVVVLQASKILEIRPHAEVSAREAHNADANVDADILVRDGIDGDGAVNARPDEANTCRHVRTNSRSR